MKKILFAMGVMLAATFTLTNCTKELQNPQDVKTPYTIYANTAETKTANDGLSTVWVEGDALNVFATAAGSTEYGTSSKFTLADAASGKFETDDLKAELAATNDWYALYPYSQYVTTPASTDAGYIYFGNKNGLTQEEYNSTSHLSGSTCPLYGVAEAVAGTELPAIEMQHLTSVVKINVTNGTSSTFAIKDLSFTSSAGDIVGHYFVDFTQDVPELTPRTGNVSNTASLTVTNPSDLAPSQTASFYIVVRPFTAPANSTLTIKIGSVEKTKTLAEEVVFAAGKIKSINYTLKEVPVEVPPTKATVEDFLAAAEDDTWYELTGTISNLTNTTFGNFDLTDATGKVYVYGLTKTKVASNDKSFASIGLKEGDVVTMIGKRSSHNGTPQVGGPAYYVSHVAVEEPEPEPGAEIATFDFNANEWGLPVSAQGTENDGNITSPVKSGDVTMTVYKGTASTATRLWQGSSKKDLRAYKGSSLAFSVPEGYVITKMTFSGSKVSDDLFTPANGKYSSKIWEGKSNPAIFTFTGTINVDTVVVEYEEGTGDSPELPEDSEPEPEPEPETPPTSSGTKTVAEFIRAADTQNYYELTGTVSNFNSNYCSFDLTDASGTIYVYSVLSASKSEWASKISDGGTVTLLGKYQYYEKSSKHEVVDAHIVSFTAGTTEPDEPEVGGDEDGTTVTFDWATLATTTNQEYTGQTVDGVKLEGYRVATNKAGQFRVYKPDNGDNAYFTLSAEKLITRVEITFTGEDNDGPLTAEGYADGVWEGSANAVTFTNASTEQARIKKIVVTLGN